VGTKVKPQANRKASMNKFWWIANPFDEYYYKFIPIRKEGEYEEKI